LSSIRGKYIIPLVISLGVFGYVLIFGWPYTFQLIFVANSFTQELKMLGPTSNIHCAALGDDSAAYFAGLLGEFDQE